MLTTEAMVAEKPEEKRSPDAGRRRWHGRHGRMGGMSGMGGMM